MPNASQSIVIGPNGPPANTAIGLQAKTLIWSCAASGPVTSVSITGGGSAFGQGAKNGDNYEVPYYGSSTSGEEWTYTVDSTCGRPRLDQFSAKLNNGSG